MPTAFFFGIGGAVVCRQALRIKFTSAAQRFKWVDNGDTFATHCVGGVLATIATGLFARKEVAAYDGETDIAGGVFFDGNVRQLGVQLLEALIGFVWSFVGSFVLYALIDCVPGLEVLADDEYVGHFFVLFFEWINHEANEGHRSVVAGMDASQMDESLYEAQWAEEIDYHPFGKDSVRLE